MQIAGLPRRMILQQVANDHFTVAAWCPAYIDIIASMALHQLVSHIGLTWRNNRKKSLQNLADKEASNARLLGTF